VTIEDVAVVEGPVVDGSIEGLPQAASSKARIKTGPGPGSRGVRGVRIDLG
jgi:hypothetical protein